MSDLFRDAPIGQIIRYITKDRLLKYAEEVAGWECPHSYQEREAKAKAAAKQTETTPESNDNAPLEKTATANDAELPVTPPDEKAESEESMDLEKIETAKIEDDPNMIKPGGGGHPLGESISRVGSRVILSKTTTLSELNHAITTSALEKGPTQVIVPEKLSDGTILVDWYDTDDSDNPQNWSFRKKMFVTFQIWYVFGNYASSTTFC